MLCLVMLFGYRLVEPGYDRISELPESLLTHILSFLPTKDSVKTSVLSSRWKNLWLNVSGLDLNTVDFLLEENQVFINFIDRFLEFNSLSRLQKFKVNYSIDEICGIEDRIRTALNRGIQHLDLKAFYHNYKYFKFMPMNLYTSKTLVFLKLSSSRLGDPGFVSMPCLKFMQLIDVQWHGTMNLEKLISGCPVLEELTLSRYKHKDFGVTRLRSLSLKRFYVVPRHGFSNSLTDTLEIDAPGLEYMSLGEDQFSNIVGKNLSSLFMVDLGIKYLLYSSMGKIHDFLTGISSVRHMIISLVSVKALYLYSKEELVPKFNNLSRLQAAFQGHLLHFLPAFLESFPNLKHLILTVVYTKTEIPLFELKDVPRCFLSTLECVEMEEYYGWKEETMKIASYFLENAAVLKKFVVGPKLTSTCSRVEMLRELNNNTKRSRRCGIILDY